MARPVACTIVANDCLAHARTYASSFLAAALVAGFAAAPSCARRRAAAAREQVASRYAPAAVAACLASPPARNAESGIGLRPGRVASP